MMKSWMGPVGSLLLVLVAGCPSKAGNSDGLGSAGTAGGSSSGGSNACPSVRVDGVDPVVCNSTGCSAPFHLTIRSCGMPVAKVGVEFVDSNFSHGSSKFIDVQAFPGEGSLVFHAMEPGMSPCTPGAKLADRVDAFLYAGDGSMLADDERTDLVLTFQCN